MSNSHTPTLRRCAKCGLIVAIDAPCTNCGTGTDAEQVAEAAYESRTEPGPSAGDTARTICRTCGTSSPAHLSTKGQCIECWNDPELRGIPDGRTFYVVGDPQDIEYPLLRDAQRRADTLWHRDAISFPVTIRAYDPDTQESADVQDYHAGPFTY